MFENLNLNTETILILGIVIFVALTLLGLVIWNSKTNKQVKTLISIDDSLKHIDTLEQETTEEDQQTEVAAETGEADESANLVDGIEAVEETEEIMEPVRKFNTGKSGRVYTKEELEAQIR